MSTTGRDEPGPQIPAQQWLMRQSCKTQPVKPEKQRRGVTSPPCQTPGGFAGRFATAPPSNSPSLAAPNSQPFGGEQARLLGQTRSRDLDPVYSQFGEKNRVRPSGFCPVSVLQKRRRGISPGLVPQKLWGEPILGVAPAWGENPAPSSGRMRRSAGWGPRTIVALSPRSRTCVFPPFSPLSTW